jgi:hypothetical protein
MILKRKRSEENFCQYQTDSSSSPSSERAASISPTRPLQWQYDGGTAMHDSQSINGWEAALGPMAYYPTSTAQYLHGRTRKRFRDNRPDENTMHEQTLEKLYQAQQPHAIPQQTQACRPCTASTASKREASQASLHSFWALPHRPSLTQTFVGPAAEDQRSTCEDCDNVIVADGMEIDGMDMGYGCRRCSRTVCDTCAVVVPGEGRECLQCKTSTKRWVGGLGWMPTTYL